MTDTVQESQTTQPSTHLSPASSGPSVTASDSLRRGMRSILRSWWIILICAVVAVAAGVGVQRQQTKQYSATTYVLLGSGDFSQAITGGYTQNDLQNTSDTAASLLTPLRRDRAASLAKVPLNSDWSVSASPSSTTSVMTVDGKTTDPKTAARLADAAARQIIDANDQSIVAQLATARLTLSAQRAAAPNKERKLSVQGQLNNLDTLQALADRNITILERALPPSASTAASQTKIGAISLVLGLLIGLAIALFRPERKRSATTTAAPNE